MLQGREGIVRIALARACWATYADRETHDPCKVNALALAASQIFAAGNRLRPKVVLHSVGGLVGAVPRFSH